MSEQESIVVKSGIEEKKCADNADSASALSDKNNNTMIDGEKALKNTDEKSEDDQAAAAKSAEGGENELILIQDNAFTIKISVPGLDLFDLQVTSMELVQEINQMLMDKEETCHRTCFSLQLDGVTMDNFSELKSIEGLKDGSIVKLVDGL